MVRLATLFLGFFLLSGTAHALTDQERNEVERLRVYLNGIVTMQTRFVQTDGNGGLARGTFWLHRPGRLRFEYDPPVPILVIARSDFLVHYDI